MADFKISRPGLKNVEIKDASHTRINNNGDLTIVARPLPRERWGEVLHSFASGHWSEVERTKI